MILEILLVILGLLLLSMFVLSLLLSPKAINVKGGHVVVTGGSSGIGKAVAIDLAKRGANITLVARNKAKLESAKTEIESHLVDQSSQKVAVLSLDLSGNYKDVEKGLKQAEEELGPILMLVNSAGLAINARFEDTNIDDFKRSMDINFLGSTFATRAVIVGMKARRQGSIVFVSSMAGQTGVYGYTAYSASKFALRGLAEALTMEVKPYNISVTLSFPPDTDTPGYQEELKTKPKETLLISETAGMFSAEAVAKSMIDDALKGSFVSYQGLDGWMLCHLTAGMGPATSFLEIVQQVFLMGIFRLVSLFYLVSFDMIIKKCKAERDAADQGGDGKKAQ